MRGTTVTTLPERTFVMLGKRTAILALRFNRENRSLQCLACKAAIGPNTPFYQLRQSNLTFCTCCVYTTAEQAKTNPVPWEGDET